LSQETRPKIKHLLRAKLMSIPDEAFLSALGIGMVDFSELFKAMKHPLPEEEKYRDEEDEEEVGDEEEVEDDEEDV